MPGFDESTELLTSAFSLLKIVVDLVPMLEVVADRRIDVGKCKSGIAVHDLFRRRPFLKGMDDEVEEDPRPTNAYIAMLVHAQRDGIGRDDEGGQLLAHRCDYTAGSDGTARGGLVARDAYRCLPAIFSSNTPLYSRPATMDPVRGPRR